MEIYFIALGIMLSGAIISLFVRENLKIKINTIFCGIGMFLLTCLSIPVLATGNAFGISVYLSPLFRNVNFVIDPLSAFFILVISIMGFLGLVYANGYLKPYLGKNYNINSHCLFLVLLLMSMIGVVTVQNSLLFLIVWESMSLSSFFLVLFENNISASIKYLVYMHISVLFIIGAFTLLNIHSNSLNFLI